jgi:tRNA(fMet)-specific endonuclease VapC
VIERLALDTSAAIDYMREVRQSPPQIEYATTVVIPLPVVGELFHGAQRSAQPDRGNEIVERLIARWQPLIGDVQTARVYGDIRATLFQGTGNLSVSKKNDLWIAALCIQHDLPLLTNDAGFDDILGLTVIHW